MNKKYYIGCTNYVGDNLPDEILNKELLPLLNKLKISEKNIDAIVKSVSKIADAAYRNGYECCECDHNEEF